MAVKLSTLIAVFTKDFAFGAIGVFGAFGAIGVIGAIGAFGSTARKNTAFHGDFWYQSHFYELMYKYMLLQCNISR